MSSRSERDALVKILADMTEQQERLQSKVLGKVIHYLRIWINRLYREATKQNGDNVTKDISGV